MKSEIASFITNTIDVQSNRFIVVDDKFIVQYVNRAFCQWVGKEECNLLGHSVYDLFYKDKQQERSDNYSFPLIKTMKENKELSSVECYLPIPHEGSWVLVNTYLHRYETGRPQYAAACYEEINKYKAAEDRLKGMSLSVIKSFAKAIDARDKYTGKHSENVANLMVNFAEHLELSKEEVSLAYLSGLIHDIGKVGVPEQILNKPTSLEETEFALIRRHPAIGADILSEISEFGEITEAVRYHHERFDGKGYPHGLKGLCIPFFSRMLALCDSYDAMTTVRCYREPLEPDCALREIELNCGKQFDPELGRQFIAFILKSQSIQAYIS